MRWLWGFSSLLLSETGSSMLQMILITSALARSGGADFILFCRDAAATAVKPQGSSPHHKPVHAVFSGHCWWVENIFMNMTCLEGITQRDTPVCLNRPCCPRRFDEQQWPPQSLRKGFLLWSLAYKLCCMYITAASWGCIWWCCCSVAEQIWSFLSMLRECYFETFSSCLWLSQSKNSL